jgi:hypothetical protein
MDMLSSFVLLVKNVSLGDVIASCTLVDSEQAKKEV